jgi:hypothetical protein
VGGLEEDESAVRAGGGGEVAAERGDEAVAVTGVQIHGHRRRGEGGGGRHGWDWDPPSGVLPWTGLHSKARRSSPRDLLETREFERDK